MPLTNEKIEAIRKACIAVNPEIVELKFGCELYYPSYPMNAVIISDSPTGNGNIRSLRTDKGHGFFTDVVNSEGTLIRRNMFEGEELWKIIGRPIRLADVLLVIEDPVCGAMEEALELIDPSYKHAWNLRNDNLLNQSSDTVDYIYDLIK